MRAARHFFSAHLAQTGTPEDARKAIMGHAKIATTARYTHWTPETLAALADEAREAIGVGNEMSNKRPRKAPMLMKECRFVIAM